VSGDATQTPFLFNGMYGVMTDENNLYYMRARFYSPEIKRFVNQDVLLGNIAEGQTLNRFAFVTGNPVSFVDPWGFFLVSPEEYTKIAYGTRTVSGTLIGWSTRVLGVTVSLLFYSPNVGEGSDIVPNTACHIPYDVSTITNSYGLFECEECANALAEALQKAGIRGKRIEINTNSDKIFESEF